MVQIRKIQLTNFRNFPSQKFEFSEKLILFVGRNGVGKTNFLESLTTLGRSSSLRGCDFEDMVPKDLKEDKKNAQFVVYSEVANHPFIEKISTSFQLSDKKKKFYINDAPFAGKRQADLKNHLINFIFLTPSLEQLFILGKSARREYLDKIVSDVDCEHSSRINSYQKFLKERLSILQKYRTQNVADKWLDIVENNIVETAIAIASARIEAVEFFNKARISFSSNFPKPELEIIGDVESEVMKQSSVKLENIYREKLRQNRLGDLQKNKTDFGVHRSDFNAIFPEKKMSAIDCSTGEQKSIMISITLARAKISTAYKNQPTILIFDEVISHLDEKRKYDLFCEIDASSLQSFFSATSADLLPAEFLQKNPIQIIELNS